MTAVLAHKTGDAAVIVAADQRHPSGWYRSWWQSGKRSMRINRIPAKRGDESPSARISLMLDRIFDTVGNLRKPRKLNEFRLVHFRSQEPLNGFRN
jgi:hypothetical protein